MDSGLIIVFGLEAAIFGCVLSFLIHLVIGRRTIWTMLMASLVPPAALILADTGMSFLPMLGDAELRSLILYVAALGSVIALLAAALGSVLGLGARALGDAFRDR